MRLAGPAGKHTGVKIIQQRQRGRGGRRGGGGGGIYPSARKLRPCCAELPGGADSPRAGRAAQEGGRHFRRSFLVRFLTSFTLSLSPFSCSRLAEGVFGGHFGGRSESFSRCLRRRSRGMLGEIRSWGTERPKSRFSPPLFAPLNGGITPGLGPRGGTLRGKRCRRGGHRGTPTARREPGAARSRPRPVPPPQTAVPGAVIVAFYHGFDKSPSLPRRAPPSRPPHGAGAAPVTSAVPPAPPPIGAAPVAPAR